MPNFAQGLHINTLRACEEAMDLVPLSAVHTDSTGISQATAKNYLSGRGQKFTWEQVFLAAGLYTATLTPIHTIDFKFKSQEYSDLTVEIKMAYRAPH